MNLGSRKGLSDNQTTLAAASIIALAAIISVGIFVSGSAGEEPTEDAGVYFQAIASEDPGQMDSPWASGNDLDVTNAVVFDEDEQTTAGNASFQETADTTLDGTETSYINVDVGGDGAAPLELEADYDNVGNATGDNVNADKVQLRDYDETDVVGTFDSLQFQQENAVTVSGVESGDYVLQLDFEFQSVDVSSAGTSDEIVAVDMTLDSADAPSDEPTEAESFSYFLEGQ